MTTTYEIYTNDGGTPKAVTGNAPAIVERVEALEETLDNGVVTSVNGNTGGITPEQTGCLPLSGGTMMGDVIFNTGWIKSTTDQSSFGIYSAVNNNDGGRIVLYNKTHGSQAGQVVLTAITDSSTHTQMKLTPNGTLQVGGKNVVRSVNNTSADANGNVSITSGYHTGNATSVGGASATKPSVVVTTWKSGNNWYRKWSDGFIEQGGLTSTMAHKSKLTFNTAFSDKNYVFTATGNFDSYNWVYINTYERATSNCMLSIVRGGDGISAPVSWYACGY